MIEEKRSNLGRFIKEQVLGPGAIGYRFVDTRDPKLLEVDFLGLLPVNNSGEILNTVPGGSYSTGILFPVDKSQTARTVNEKEENRDEGNENVDGDIDDESTLNINQMYPNMMGLTCAFSNPALKKEDIKITLAARYYTKVKTAELKEYGVLYEGDKKEFLNFLAQLPEQSFVKNTLALRSIGVNNILMVNSTDSEVLSKIRSEIADINRQKAVEFGSDKQWQVLSGLKEHLFWDVRNSPKNKEEKAAIISRIEGIERIESIIAHITDLLGIYLDAGYGLWKSEYRTVNVVLPEIPVNVRGKEIYNHKKVPGLGNHFKVEFKDESHASMGLNLQFSKDSRGFNSKLLFLKLQLVNTSTEFTQAEGDKRYFSVFNEKVNQRCFFGVSIKVESKDLVPYRAHALQDKLVYSEDDVSKFLYRQYDDFAIGHGCSVKWDNGQAVKTVETEYLPTFDTPDVDSTPRDSTKPVKTNGHFEPAVIFESSNFMEFKWLSTLSNASDLDVTKGLEVFVAAYADWVKRKREETKGEEGPNKVLIDQELAKCAADMARMKNNIDKLLAGKANLENLAIFRMMNTAMFMQLWHGVKVKGGDIKDVLNENFVSFNTDFYKDADDKLFGKASAAWRPFQLAFILLNLDGIFQLPDDNNWDARNKWVDLVWFPTGGGKTEAYLGLIALALINRRSRYGEAGGGTGVIMRYTLRLLTLQQFQRATLLIMALELMRRWDSSQLGSEPINIGLWVGSDSLPNYLKGQARNSLLEEFQSVRDAQEAGKPTPKSKIPFVKCPWCGTELNKIRFEEGTGPFGHNRILLLCNNKLCSFSVPEKKSNRRPDHGAIPVSLCDEEIYQHPPALLFGTVDKFAQLAHKASTNNAEKHKDSRRLFGVGNWEKGKPSGGYLTPDLIIQDELHLLLGPLGSAVALFESAVDQLCTRSDGKLTVRPKIISSTATTRNTDFQIMALFDRKVNLFPKPGIQCDDSFFSFYKRKYTTQDGNPEYVSKRKYLGIMPTGRTQI